MSTAPLQVVCPTCRKEALWAGNPSRPFCSERCRLVDLGAWAEERYRIAAKDEAPTGEDAEPQT